MSGNISISAPKAPSPTISFATGGAPGNITVTPRSAPAPKPAAATPPPPSPVYTTPSYTPEVYAPVLDTKSIYATASANANANVNPYYTKLLNDFVGQQAQAKTLQQQQTATNIQNLQDQLAQVQQANAVSGERATQDTATNEAQIAQTADNRQVDQGTAFNSARNTQAVDLAKSGLTGSGLGAGQQAVSRAVQDTTETRQAQADQTAKNAQEITKARTFEDLATSNKYATTTESKGEAQANFDLNKFIVGQTSDLQQQQQQLEQQRQSALAVEQANQTKILVSNFINSISNPAQRQAAYSAYGSLL